MRRRVGFNGRHKEMIIQSRGVAGMGERVVGVGERVVGVDERVVWVNRMMSGKSRNVRDGRWWGINICDLRSRLVSRR